MGQRSVQMCALEVLGNKIGQRQTEGAYVFVLVYEWGKDGRGESGVMEDVNNCGGLVAPIHTTEVILH